MAKTKYNGGKTLQIIRDLDPGITTNDQIGTVLGIAHTTVKEWMRRHRAFRAAVLAHKDRSDTAVENALLKRALGYDYEESKTVGKGDDAVTTTFKRTMAPSERAAEFWLKNRKKKEWQAVPEPPASGDGEAETIRTPLAGPPRAPKKKATKKETSDGKSE